MKTIVLLCLIGYVAAQGHPTYVWDLLKQPLNTAEVAALISSKAEDLYPMLNSIPQTDFDCAKKNHPGFYADLATGCQVFHRCDINGNMTNYLCVNSTLFNQITLICDYFYNVDCQKFSNYEDFANSRLYTDQPLFDTPPADYVPPGIGAEHILAAAAAEHGGLAASPATIAATSRRPITKGRRGKAEEGEEAVAGGAAETAGGAAETVAGQGGAAPAEAAGGKPGAPAEV